MARARKVKPAAPGGLKVFVVQERGDGVPDGAFIDRAAADAHRRERDRAARASACPFDPGEPATLSSDAAARFWQVLTALGLDPPKRGQEWRDWWEVVCSETTAEQRDALWDSLDNWHHYVVVEVPLED